MWTKGEVEQLGLHRRGPCIACVDAGSSFDYCRACGFTDIPFEEDKEPNADDPLLKGINRARGSYCPEDFRPG